MGDSTKDSEPVYWPIIHGFKWFPGTTQEMADTFPRLVARERDIFIVSFPKSGTTWTQEIVWQILLDGKIDYRRLDVRVPFVEGMIQTYAENPYCVSTPEMIEKMFESFPSPRVFKSHLPYHLVPKGRDEAAKPRYIYVMRNPKDTAVSFYHHCQFIPSRKKWSWDEFFELFLKGETGYGLWFDNVLSWWKHRDDPHILFLKFEEMKKDPSCAIQQIARFIGKELSRETLELIVEQTKFSVMKTEENVSYKWMSGHKGDFIRKGEVGDWRNHFTEEQSALFDKVYTKRMAGTGLQFEFDGEQD